jgi:hypothetical protein
MSATGIIATGKIVSRLIGNDIVIYAITDVASSIYNILYGIQDINDDILGNFIKQIDIKAQIKTIECLIKNIDPRLKTISLNMSLYQLHEIILMIREDLKNISQKYLEHQMKWFKFVRYLDLQPEFNLLKEHNNILDKRLDMFMKVFQVESIKINCHHKNKQILSKEKIL